jgi:hypothetical protein
VQQKGQQEDKQTRDSHHPAHLMARLMGSFFPAGSRFLTRGPTCFTSLGSMGCCFFWKGGGDEKEGMRLRRDGVRSQVGR